jgi:hypothetical protein
MLGAGHARPKGGKSMNCDKHTSWLHRLVRHDFLLIQGALDSLGVTLAEHHHEWTDGERAIYEEATRLVGTAISADCMGSDSSASTECYFPTPLRKRRLQVCLALVRLLASEYSLWRVALAAGLLAASSASRRFVSIYSWCVLGWRKLFLPNVSGEPAGNNAKKTDGPSEKYDA